MFEAGLTLDSNGEEHPYPRLSKSHDDVAQGLHELFIRLEHGWKQPKLGLPDKLRLKDPA
jgi:hypothetical protein